MTVSFYDYCACLEFINPLLGGALNVWRKLYVFVHNYISNAARTQTHASIIFVFADIQMHEDKKEKIPHIRFIYLIQIGLLCHMKWLLPTLRLCYSVDSAEITTFTEKKVLSMTNLCRGSSMRLDSAFATQPTTTEISEVFRYVAQRSATALMFTRTYIFYIHSRWIDGITAGQALRI